MKNKNVQITFNDGSEWVLPVSAIIANRAKTYTDDETEYNEAYKESEAVFNDCPDEIEDWIVNNMDWESDIRPVAVLAKNRDEPDYDLYDAEIVLI